MSIRKVVEVVIIVTTVVNVFIRLFTKLKNCLTFLLGGREESVKEGRRDRQYFRSENNETQETQNF